MGTQTNQPELAISQMDHRLVSSPGQRSEHRVGHQPAAVSKPTATTGVRRIVIKFTYRQSSPPNASVTIRALVLYKHSTMVLLGRLCTLLQKKGAMTQRRYPDSCRDRGRAWFWTDWWDRLWHPGAGL